MESDSDNEIIALDDPRLDAPFWNWPNFEPGLTARRRDKLRDERAAVNAARAAQGKRRAPNMDSTRQAGARWSAASIFERAAQPSDERARATMERHWPGWSQIMH